MLDLNIEEFSMLPEIKNRGFICPCGKSYLSNPALYTHIKQKHHGKPPGQISKPKNFYFKRGRPISKVNIINLQNSHINRSITIEEQELFEKPVSNSVNLTGNQEDAQQTILSLCSYLKDKPSLIIKKYLLNQIEAFIQMSVYLRMKKPEKLENKAICLADGVIQFLKQICQQLDWQKFQHLFVFFMIFLQYLLDQFNDKSLLWEAPLDITCQNVNLYLQQNMKVMSEHFQLSYLWVFEQECSMQIFNAFFKWSMAKKYSQYKIISEKQQIEIQTSADHN